MSMSVTENPAETFRLAIQQHESAPRRRYNEGASRAVLVDARCDGRLEATYAHRRISERLGLRAPAAKVSA